MVAAVLLGLLAVGSEDTDMSSDVEHFWGVLD